MVWRSHVCDANNVLATSVAVERVFSTWRILLSHVRNRLSVQTTRALMCVGAWSRLGLIKDRDVRAVTILPEIAEEDEEHFAEGWDKIAF
jgi:hAT family C-terminal dimerisation region